jgi:hypothetical protein
MPGGVEWQMSLVMSCRAARSDAPRPTLHAACDPWGVLHSAEAHFVECREADSDPRCIDLSDAALRSA